MEEPAAAEERQGATQRRKAWAKSRDSWQASEAEDFSAAAAALARGEEEEEEEEEEEDQDHLAGEELPLAAEAGQCRRCRDPRGSPGPPRAGSGGRPRRAGGS